MATNQCNMFGTGIDFTAEADSVADYSNEAFFGSECLKGDPMCDDLPTPPPPPKGGKFRYSQRHYL